MAYYIKREIMSVLTEAKVIARQRLLIAFDGYPSKQYPLAKLILFLDCTPLYKDLLLQKNILL